MQMAIDARALADELGLAGRNVFFNEGWVDYSERQNFLLEANVGVTVHFDSAETRFSFRTRALDYLWAGLPIVATDGDAFAELIEREGLGLTVPAEDPEALEEALYRLLTDWELGSGAGSKLSGFATVFAGQRCWSRSSLSAGIPARRLTYRGSRDRRAEPRNITGRGGNRDTGGPFPGPGGHKPTHLFRVGPLPLSPGRNGAGRSQCGEQSGAPDPSGVTSRPEPVPLPGGPWR